ncbi:hypothetical protein [Pseudomonas putida]|uniref:Uncharacterized protein n=1 Tax=Pseudomonas putida TaxID=303 RepID=A0A7V8EHE8_PSEPU|nr:hypothetical protein [Pseudomonas putida]KAF0254272.1 hypothetical protein GN299_13530 [Pseudomonas putida]
MFDFNLPVAHIPDNYREFLPTMTTPAVDEMLISYEKGEAEMRRLHADLMSKENRGTLQSFAYGAEAYHQSKSKSVFWASDLLELFVRIPRSSGHPFHEHLTTDSTLIRPPIPRASGH